MCFCLLRVALPATRPMPSDVGVQRSVELPFPPSPRSVQQARMSSASADAIEADAPSIHGTSRDPCQEIDPEVHRYVSTYKMALKEKYGEPGPRMH